MHQSPGSVLPESGRPQGEGPASRRRGVLMPAALALLGDRAWYLPRRLRWLPGGRQSAAGRSAAGRSAVRLPGCPLPGDVTAPESGTIRRAEGLS